MLLPRYQAQQFRIAEALCWWLGKGKQILKMVVFCESNAQFNLSPLFVNLYDGSMSGSLVVNAQDLLIITIKQNLTGINVVPLTKDAVNFDTMEGNVGMVLQCRATVSVR
ncbi:MAG: hypothetical protein N2A40_04585 [Desulfobulbaceae bacterium]